MREAIAELSEWSLPKEKKTPQTFPIFFKRQNKFIFTSEMVLSDAGDSTKLTFCLLNPPDISVLRLYTSHPSLLASVEVQGAPCLDLPLQRVPSFSAETSATLHSEELWDLMEGKQIPPPSIRAFKQKEAPGALLSPVCLSQW